MPSAPGRTPRGLRASAHSLASAGCENCRENHIKCDKVSPTCGRCRTARRRCRWTGLKIRFIKSPPYAEEQKWIRTPRRLIFVNETKVVIRNAQNSGDPHDLDMMDWDVSTPATSEDEAGPTTPPLPSASDTKPPLPAPSSRAQQTRPGTEQQARRDKQPRPERPGAEIRRQTSAAGRAETVWPLTDPTEAFLFRHFVHNLAIWLDVCDSRRSFQTVVPQRAGKCPILLNAILALAARHMSHIKPDFDASLSNHFHERTLEELIPRLSHAATVDDEDLFAATIILRLLEEIEVQVLKVDNNNYLLGIHTFVDAAGDRPHHSEPGSLAAACFWIGLRQEIYSATMTRKPVRISLAHPFVGHGPAASTDEERESEWANRAVLHCADVINFCFGGEAEGEGEGEGRGKGKKGGSQGSDESKAASAVEGDDDDDDNDGMVTRMTKMKKTTGPSVARWRELDEWSRHLWDARPDACVPMFCQDEDSGPFPEIWYHSSCHVVGIQHHLLAELFLAWSNPSLPQTGSQRQTAERQMTHRIQSLVRRLLGIGLGNQFSPPGMFLNCQAIAVFGYCFHERRDQEAMVTILKKTEKDHMRPITDSVLHLMESWGGVLDEGQREMNGHGTACK